MATRKIRKSGKKGTRRANRVFTVEGLHSTFEKIDNRVRCMIERGKTDTVISCCLRKAWQEFFQQDLSNPAVEGMIRHYRSVYSPKGRRGTRKSQKGGMAPLDYTMGQGITGAVYGRFPVEIGATPSVVGSLDHFFESPVGRSCDSTGGYPAPPQAGGKRRSRKQRGGAVFDTFFQGHAPASVPRNIIETGVSTLQGAPISNPSASPIAYTASLRDVGLQPFNPSSIGSMSSLAPVYQGY
jgi:hypothetical protein